MFKEFLKIQVEKAFPTQNRGRPPLLTFDDAYADIMHVVRTGMQWRHLKPKNVSFITVCIDGSVQISFRKHTKPCCVSTLARGGLDIAV